MAPIKKGREGVVNGAGSAVGGGADIGEMTAAQKRAQRLSIMKYARAKCDLEMGKYDLYVNAEEGTPIEKQDWQKPLVLGD